MQAYKQQFLEYWSQRSAREQRLLTLMGAVLGVAFLYLGVWEPAQASLQRNRGAVARLQAEAGMVESLAAEADKLKRQPAQTPLPAKELIPLLQQTAKSQGASLANLQFSPDGESGVDVEGVVGFDDWVRYLGILSAQQQVRVVSAKAEAQGVPGQAKVKALLMHAGAAE
ncbi:type II secretion system protein GspM [Chromobacterium sp. IIBBL 290-4]|uniref:type II secretion system protein GspM n=1 Tax=Chromobacterium sp. IIBBL 290-4 TaxID=2953890 RepID=UPI0020B82F33|nr:type II secretion system protein M [Chromobacterium sp. IIBBL 290-4]UTH72285.1 type II secretion system protein M [Chromobacterium sp. IIBBL 290-4]